MIFCLFTVQLALYETLAFSECIFIDGWLVYIYLTVMFELKKLFSVKRDTRMMTM